ncbi:putative nuclease [Saitoella complicata NRRL Y-17804]|uniref:putative nuclease n=1 Tax=Saitoella complicata (strain BCRC 22490 / CBS 7301 / JCM 7358 / NBRC 10748 / NRRL Y-17804) TaxID=698492 RepID=UPI00086694D9|nr:putative nuclease [Saitoella complicata NRRL Y-17804]ODQ56535.1 putative nuclease [Saitoella complicata NRRL Y-17804]
MRIPFFTADFSAEQERKKKLAEETVKKREDEAPITALIEKHFDTVLHTAILTSAVLGSVYFWRRNLRRFPTANHVTPELIARKKPLVGYVTSVGDGDNFRFYHTPGGWLTGWHWLRKIPTGQKALKDQTIHVRLAGIDAPECAHFGKPAQPYSAEALAWLRGKLLNRRVRVQLYQRDQYTRVVGMCWYWKWGIWKQNVSLEMLQVGLATVYTSAGSVYGEIEQDLLKAEKTARSKKVGMWKLGEKYESPAAYKQRTGQAPDNQTF